MTFNCIISKVKSFIVKIDMKPPKKDHLKLKYTVRIGKKISKTWTSTRRTKVLTFFYLINWATMAINSFFLSIIILSKIRSVSVPLYVPKALIRSNSIIYFAKCSILSANWNCPSTRRLLRTVLRTWSNVNVLPIFDWLIISTITNWSCNCSVVCSWFNLLTNFAPLVNVETKRNYINLWLIY